jgi:hypothetical protein
MVASITGSSNSQHGEPLGTEAHSHDRQNGIVSRNVVRGCRGSGSKIGPGQPKAVPPPNSALHLTSPPLTLRPGK